jgi:hypothetical protein
MRHHQPQWQSWISVQSLVSDDIEVATYTIIMRNVKTAAAVFPALLSVPEYRSVVMQSTINIQSRITRDTAARGDISLVHSQYNR